MRHLSFVLGTFAMVGCTDVISSDEIDDSTIERHGNDNDNDIPNNRPFVNPLGFSATFSTAGNVDVDSEFFQDFGTNERTCGSCHKASEGWTVSAERVRHLFRTSRGLDPIFRTNDGSNRPDADVSTLEARRSAYSMLLNRGTIRVGIGMPAVADFELVSVDDPYGYASAGELSLFRRPLPAANLTAIPTVMWDGRVTGATVEDALKEQANGATQGHAAAPNPLTDETRQQIVDFEMALFNAQLFTFSLGRLDSGVGGGAETLASQTVQFSTTIPPRDARRWNLFDAWQNSRDADKRAVYRGQELFNTRSHVPGRSEFTCTNCHTAQNFGTDIAGRFFNVLDPATKPLRRAADQPLYTFRYTGPSVPNRPNGMIIQTTDPGRALITGKFADMGRFKVPSIRALGARAPYFHDGSAPTLAAVVKDYETRQDFNFTDAEEADLVAFLSAL